MDYDLIRPGLLYVDFVVVHIEWRRRGINEAMIQMLLRTYPGFEPAFSKPTTLGAKFVAGRWPIRDIPRKLGGGR